MKTEPDGEAINHLNRPDQHQGVILIRNYPHYWDPDQLYDLQADPYERHNLLADLDSLPPRRKQEVLAIFKDHQERLRTYLATFKDHPYPLDDKTQVAWMKSAEYKKKVEKTMSLSAERLVPWWNPRSFRWPFDYRPLDFKGYQ